MPILQSISRFFQKVQIPLTAAISISSNKKVIQKNIEKQLAGTNNINDESDYEHIIKEIKEQDAIIFSAVLAEAVCALYGGQITAEERLTISNLAAITIGTKNTFNQKVITQQNIAHLIYKPEEINSDDAREKHFLRMYNAALALAPHPQQMKQQFYAFVYALQLSEQQNRPGLSYEVINDITIRKGGSLALLYRSVFKHPFKNGEERMLYCVGGLMQLSNDIMRVYKDDKNGVHTLATTAVKIEELRFHFTALLQIAKETAYKSGYPKKHVRKFLGIIFFSIFSRCYVYLDRLKALEKGSKGNFTLRSYSKKDLEVNMNSMTNKLKLLRYYMRWSQKK